MKKAIQIILLCIVPFVSFSQIGSNNSYELEEKITSKPITDLQRYKCIKNTGAFKGHGLFSVLKSKISFYKASKKARRYSSELYPNQKGANTKRDAYRHAIWSALLARHFGSISSIQHRVEFAKAVGDANEVCGANYKDGLQMDLHNNRIGRDVFQNNTKYRKLFKMTIGLKKPTVSVLKNKIFKMVAEAHFINRAKGVESTFNEIKKRDASKLVFIEE